MALKTIGMTLFLIGFFWGSLITVTQVDDAGLEWGTIDWAAYVGAVVLGTIGVIMLRIHASRVGKGSEKVDSDLSVIGSALEKLVERIRAIIAQKDSIGVYDVHLKLDEELAEEIGVFVDARESIAHRHGLQPYADLMSKFALGERNINRAWSASADGYVDEVWRCLQRAESLLDEARSQFSQFASN